ncbi:MAG TPA: hypothetical protein VGI17_15100 [Solirubrobacterales bacterium]|jgi:hypothetical protein
MAANPEAIAWYLKRSEALLDDHRERVESLRLRGGQLAGFSGAVLALAGANADTTLVALHGTARDFAGISLLFGSVLLIAASVTALNGALVPRVVPVVTAEEVANYATERFIEEHELWRVHLRTIHSLTRSIVSTTRLGDRAARAIRRAERLFFAGLSLVGIALGILVVVVTF